jgi:hypothetical protein
MNENLPNQEEIEFEVDQHVFVKKRTTPRINKLGGIGKVTGKVQGSNGWLYSVKYAIEGKEEGIHWSFISPQSFSSGRPTRKPLRPLDSNLGRRESTSAPLAAPTPLPPHVQEEEQHVEEEKEQHGQTAALPPPPDYIELVYQAWKTRTLRDRCSSESSVSP